jgi:prepilin-type N-terminal cleavage/methylation domain-containing protein
MSPKRQFTLIELVVVISIISILMGITLASINMAKKKAKFTNWLAYNNMLSKDPDTVLNFNFSDTDAKIASDSALTNSAVGCGVQDFDAKLSTGLIKNATWVNTGGRSRFHHALQFDGRRSYVEIQNNKALDFDAEKEDFTIMMWVRFDSISSTRVLCGKAEWNRIAQYDLYLSSRRLEADVGRVCTGWRTPQISAGKWYHVALVSEAGKFQIYLDSVAMGTPARGSPSPQNTTSKPLTLGAIFTTGNSGTPRYNFQGRMDEFVLIRKNLKASEIKAHYEIGIP